ncbi:MAG: Na+/H+ antiporter subunit E [Nocardioides sp.]|nr:Na+/H+ antiporter subunit E [Nocardioides sp.]
MSTWSLPWRFVRFAAWYLLEVVRSSWSVLSDVLTTGHRSTPRVVRLPLESIRDGHAALIGVLITLTPGTLALGVVHAADGRRELLVHSMYHFDEPSALEDLIDMEARMLRGTTLHGVPDPSKGAEP